MRRTQHALTAAILLLGTAGLAAPAAIGAPIAGVAVIVPDRLAADAGMILIKDKDDKGDKDKDRDRHSSDRAGKTKHHAKAKDKDRDHDHD